MIVVKRVEFEEKIKTNEELKNFLLDKQPVTFYYRRRVVWNSEDDYPTFLYYNGEFIAHFIRKTEDITEFLKGIGIESPENLDIEVINLDSLIGTVEYYS